jgi:death-on-curing protein
VLQIHVDQIENYGGAVEIRDRALLESAIEQPRATFGGNYLHQFPYEMAAAYLFHLVMNHPFVDGNK